MFICSIRTKKTTVIKVISWTISLMLSYAALSKLANYQQSRAEMLNQLFAPPLALILVWLVPVLELLISICLVLRPLRYLGLWAAVALLVLFSCYISFSMTGMMGKRPCSCGGILNGMDYGWHLAFNVLFILLGCWGISLHNSPSMLERWLDHWERRSGKIV